jgi:hypothetical protein
MNVEFTDEFEAWWTDLDAEQQVRVNAGESGGELRLDGAGVILLQKLWSESRSSILDQDRHARGE